MNSITLTREAVGHYSYTEHGLNLHVLYQPASKTWHIYNEDRYETEVGNVGAAREYIERVVAEHEKKMHCGCAPHQPVCTHGSYLYEKWQAANEVTSCPGLGKLRDFARLAVLDEEQHWLDLWRTHYTPLELPKKERKDLRILS